MSEFPHGQECIELFINGHIVLDCSNDPDGYAEIMNILAQRDVVWADGRLADRIEYSYRESFVWNFRQSAHSSNGHVMTRAMNADTMTSQYPLAIVMTAQEMLQEVNGSQEITPLNLSCLYSV